MRSLLLIPVLLSLTACGNTISRTDAIDDAASALCDYYDRCGNLGPEEDAVYPNRSECIVGEKANFQNTWSVSACEDNINGEGFDQCLTRIEIAQCGNLLDIANVLLNCTSGRVCGTSDAS